MHGMPMFSLPWNSSASCPLPDHGAVRSIPGSYEVALNEKRPTILRLPTSCNSFSIRGGDEGTRTPDLLHAKQALFQLSYIPTCFNYGGLTPDVKHI